jgi:hypothetical protein
MIDYWTILKPIEFYERITTQNRESKIIKTIVDKNEYYYDFNDTAANAIYCINQKWTVVDITDLDIIFKDILRREKLQKIRLKI